MLAIAHQVENGDRGEDRVLVSITAHGAVLAIADGAGGVGGGAEAVEAVCRTIFAAVTRAAGAAERWCSVLIEVDDLLSRSAAGGMAAVVVAEIRGTHVLGASVGDSAAWLVADGEVIDLTAEQRRKPLVGSGNARPVGFGPRPLSGRLLLASDGLIKYARPRDLARCACSGSPQDGVAALLAEVRLPSGGLQDDVAVVLCEAAAQQSVAP